MIAYKTRPKQSFIVPVRCRPGYRTFIMIIFFFYLCAVYLLQFYFFYWLVVWSKGVAHLTAPVYMPGSFTTINHSVCVLGDEGLSTLTESASTQAMRTFATARRKSPAAHYHRGTTLYCNNFFFNQYFGPLGGLWWNCETKYLRLKW